jgi:hypothetical protein
MFNECIGLLPSIENYKWPWSALLCQEPKPIAINDPQRPVLVNIVHASPVRKIG